MFSFRPAKRENTPLIIGLAGPSKSGKTFSALRLATGLKGTGQIFMINTEGKRGHQYADKFDYFATDMSEPFSMARYLEAMVEVKKQNPSVLIIDSVSHAHEGIGGMLEQHESELDRMAGDNWDKRNKMTWAAWVKPKKEEANMINFMLQLNCHIILCFRAKEKLKIVKGKEPESLGWQPIGSDRIHFETAFTLILPPHSQGVPDMTALGSEFREPYNKMITAKQIDEQLGKRLAEWSMANTGQEVTKGKLPPAGEPTLKDRSAKIIETLKSLNYDSAQVSDFLLDKCGKTKTSTWAIGDIESLEVAIKNLLPPEQQSAGL
jgi:hypothetical protein